MKNRSPGLPNISMIIEALILDFEAIVITIALLLILAKLINGS